jgi:hypothetical protein
MCKVVIHHVTPPLKPLIIIKELKMQTAEPTAVKQSGVHAQTGYLEENMQVLKESINTMLKLLAPILIDANPPEETKGADPPNLVPLAMRMWWINQHLDDLITTVNNSLKRIDL